MFVNDELKTHLETSSTIKSQSAIIAEWNMNIPTNILKIGNYRYRPFEDGSPYNLLPNTFDSNDQGNFYTNATDADIVIDGGFDDNNLPVTLTTSKNKLKMLYSLEDCFKQFRPRSGINKASYFEGTYLHHANVNMANRPRYYMPDKNDSFKYWTSYRTENGIERGIANKTINNQKIITDTVPFVVYKDKIPANRVIVKMQTHTGTVDLGPFSNGSTNFTDPFYGDVNSSVPNKWKIQFLKNNNWVDAISFNPAQKRSNGNPIIGSNGYIELSYGLNVPLKYRDIFIKAEELSSITLRPEKSINGYAYLIRSNESDLGQYHIYVNNSWETFTPNYGWSLAEETVDRLTNFVTDLTSPASYTNSIDNTTKYREFEYINGIRIVVDSMIKNDSTFDLIELSPRLVVDLSEKTLDYSITKSASDLGVSGLPVGQLLASTGDITIFDYDESFNSNNTNSIIANYIGRHIQIKVYEIIVDVDGYDYFIPIKTLYSEGFPKIENSSRQVTLNLRDLYFYFESITAPQTLLTDVSLSSAIAFLLDSIGFSNYTFKRVSGETETIIPFFFIPPDKSVAEILQDLAVSTQTAMFFDEYNNFVMMSKNYFMPSISDRDIDFTLYGTVDFAKNQIIDNQTTSTKLSNIIELTSQDNEVYNDGLINYTTRYIQRSIGSLKQASLVDSDRVWIYKPVLLWEVSGTENTKSINNEVANQSSYVLSAIPLNSDLTNAVPTVSGNVVINNTVDLGEGVYWITRNNGYFYSNGEIIKYDAVQYNVSGFGNVWITNAEDYQYYFSKIPFNGKLYPTGLIRIYTKPLYEEINGVLKLKNGSVEEHGRGQFGTQIVEHFAGLNPYWYNNDNVRGCNMQSKYLFETGNTIPTTLVGNAGVDNVLAQKTTRNGVIKNFLSSTYVSETDLNKMNSTQTGTVQSSALVMNGPSFTTTESPRDFISYVYKPLTERFKHFGTRMRVIGKIENNLDRGQSAIGGTTYFVVPGTTSDKNINISGGSGGLACLLNPSTNNGYYFEIMALGSTDLTNNSKNNVNNVMFYKVMSDGSNNAIPVKLWEGVANIIVDDGKFTGQYRMVAEQNPTVYDLSVEYEDIGTIRRFYLYINNYLLTTVDDTSPLPVYNNMALFCRGSSRIMFENIYALTNNYSQNTSYKLDTPVNSIFDDNEIDTNESFRKYAMSGIIQGTYLSGISSAQPPEYKIYFEEFGSIMREAATFNIKYDKAYPALYAKLSPTFNRIKGYTVSGFRAGSYGAEFMIFNATDTALSLDETTGNYLRIQGITFTQQTNSVLKVDDYFNKNSNLSNPTINNNIVVSSPFKVAQDYDNIKLSRMTYGVKDFSLEVPYIQTQDDANALMKWLISKIMKPRKSIGIKLFATPILQLGDIVQIDYAIDSVDQAGSTSSRFVIYNIEYSKSVDGPEMSIFLSEVA